MQLTDDRTADRATLRGREIHVGGIYPFQVTSDISQHLYSDRGMFAATSARDPSILRFRRLTFDPEKSWTDNAAVFVSNIQVQSLALSNGRTLQPHSLTSYLSVYPSAGIGTIIFWLKLGSDVLEEKELIELIALSRGTVERIDANRASYIGVEWLGQHVAMNSLLQVCEAVEKEFRQLYRAEKHDVYSVQFAYPLLYVGEVVGCTTADDIVSRYKRNIAGILNLWIRNTHMLKDKEIANATQLDIHPFEYGVTYMSTSCTIEMHPYNVRDIADIENQELAEHHIREMSYLAILAELPVAKLYVLRLYDVLLSKGLKDIRVSKHPFNLVSPVILFIRAVRSSILRRTLTLAVNEFRNIHLTRKSYGMVVMDAYELQFSIPQLAESVDKKLSAIDTIVQSTFSMYIAIFTLVLTILGIYLALPQKSTEGGVAASGPEAVEKPADSGSESGRLDNEVVLQSVAAMVKANCEAGFQQFVGGLALTPGKRLDIVQPIRFRFASAELLPAEVEQISGLAQHPGSKGVERIIINGYADRIGTTAYNRDLSRRRSEVVRDALVEVGFTDIPIEVRPFGEERGPLLTPDGVAEPFNRTVEIRMEVRQSNTAVTSTCEGARRSKFPESNNQ